MSSPDPFPPPIADPSTDAPPSHDDSTQPHESVPTQVLPESSVAVDTSAAFSSSPTPNPPLDPVPSQPPLPSSDNPSPPIVEGIEHAAAISDYVSVSDGAQSPSPTSPTSEDTANVVRTGDLAAFCELFSRFHSRIEKASAGRKYRPLRTAWDAAAEEIHSTPDRIRLAVVSDLVLEALRLGCESGKVLLVDACLDCIHRLFEYGHVGASGETSDITLDVRDRTLDDLVSIVCACLEVKDEDVYLRMVQTLLTSATRTKTGLHQSTLLAAVRTIYNIYLNARMPGTRTTARVSLTQILNLVFTRMESETAEDLPPVYEFSTNPSNQETNDIHSDAPALNVPSPAPPAEEGGESNTDFASVLQRDAYLLFRALCKLSAKEFVDNNAPDAVGIRSKQLSLELLRNVISNSGPAFRSGDRFIYALRQYLCRSLLINCMWNSPEVMDVSFDIFELLLRKDTLRPLLKTEIGALFDTVVFRFLESPTAGSMRKKRALTLLSRLSADRQTLADLFLNYDCDIDSPKIFERVVHVNSSAAREKSVPEPDATTPPPSPSLAQVDTRVVALTSIVQVVRSLREWSKPLENSKEFGKILDHPSSVSISEASPIDNVPNDTDIYQPDSLSNNAHESSARHSSHDLGSVPSAEVLPSADLAARGRSLGLSRSAMGIVSEGNDEDTARFEEALKAKRETSEGVKIFNSKPKKGIKFLIEQGRLKEDAVDIAKFLHKTEGLEAAMIGEFLGDGGALSISVMHAYTDSYDFTNMMFDDALRLHLSGFRLPGEAQKIDRIMEKYASRYCECNPDAFANAEAAYLLAYATIMLHTDAHNDTIKHKMSKEEFIRNNRGINDGGDLDHKFQGNLYDRITTTEIRLSSSSNESKMHPESMSVTTPAMAAMDPAQRAKLFEQESERLMAQTKVLFARKRRPTQDYTYYSATNVHHARLMFDTAWYPILAAISLNLEEASTADSGIVSLCLDGFRHGIAISSTFSMSTAKDAFVSSLAKFTHLNSVIEMRTKNVECVRMILAIAAMEGNNLGEQWIVIVRAISLLEQIRAVASGNPEKYVLQPSSRPGGSTPILGASDRGLGIASPMPPTSGEKGGTSVGATSTEDALRRSSTSRQSTTADGNMSKQGYGQRIDSKVATLAMTVSETEIERIFSNSSTLSASGVADFCGALCTVALEELGEKPAPRLYCVQKIVEMAYYNMDSRTRIQWGKIWDQMGPFFVSAMCHSNREVGMYAIDALRQLASKFLEKDELSNFAFQRSFLKPFEMCYGRSSSAATRELVLSCISQIVLARASNIKSGWKSVFAVLSLAADESVESILNFGWQIVDSIVRKYVGVIEDVYFDAVVGLRAYTKARLSTPVSLAAIELLSGRCAASLSETLAGAAETHEGRVSDDGEVKENNVARVMFSGDDDAHIGSWFPILTGLAAAMQDDRPAVRQAANDGLHKVLLEHGRQFDPSMWALIFRGVLSPIFDDVRHLSLSLDRSETAAVGEWATTTGAQVLRNFVDVFVKQVEVTRGILPELLNLIRSWILQDSEIVAREGMSILARLIMSSGEVLTGENWDEVVNAINLTFSDTMPHEILGTGSSLSSGSSTQESSASDASKSSRSTTETTVTTGTTTSGSSYEELDRAKSQTDEGTQDGGNEVEGNGKDGSDGGTSSKVKVEVGGGAAVEKDGKVDFRVVRAKCVVQLLLIEVVQEVCVSFYRTLSTKQIVSMCDCLEMSYKFAHKFNSDIELRYSLWRSGFMNQVPNLLKQETSGLMAYLRIMFWLYLDEEREDENGWMEVKVMHLCESVLRRYITCCEEAPSKSDERREVAALSPVVSFIVNSMMQMSKKQFAKHLMDLCTILLDLLDGADDRSVRQTVTKLFRARMTPLISLASSGGALPAEDGGDHGGLPANQLPGNVCKKVIVVKVASSSMADNTEQEVMAALNKVGGVRSVTVVDDAKRDAFEVQTSAPDEMLLAGIVNLPYVKEAFVQAADARDQLD